jgi:glycosyltransferase involved in cell wall biosynthesis
LIAGDGPQRAELQRLIETRGLQEDVQLLGAVKQEDILRLYGSADVFALTCEIAADGDRDGIPVTLMEAMSMRIPVLSTKVSGIPELICSVQEGVLVDSGDAAAIADAIVYLAKHPAVAQEMAARGAQKVRDQFEISRTSEQLETLFRSRVKQLQPLLKH